MRGDDAICGRLFSYIDLEKRIRADHPLRVIRAIANAALKSLSGEFEKLYSPLGRESIPPERLLRALLLQAFYSIRSERQLVERIDHDLSAGLSGWASRTRCGMPRASPEPRPPAGGRYRSSVSRRGLGAGQGQGVAVERAFLGRRHVAGSLGEPEKLSAKGRLG
jgi:hypothetical protein